MVVEELEHVLTAMRVIPHLAALAFAYVLALPIGGIASGMNAVRACGPSPS